MKWYLAARTRHINAIKEISEFLEQKGETPVSDWIYLENLEPFEDHLFEIHGINQRIANSVLDADIFVLISDSAGTDMFVELGIAIAKNTTTNNNRIYIVGEHAKRSLLQLHPAVIHVATVSEVFEREHIDYDKFKIPTF